jgi:hypothetical protein
VAVALALGVGGYLLGPGRPTGTKLSPDVVADLQQAASAPAPTPSHSPAAAGTSASGASTSPGAIGGSSAVGPSSPPVAHLSGPGMAITLLGRPPSGLPWYSGMWTGGAANASHLAKAATWRGRPMDVAMTYPLYGTWAEIAGSEWSIAGFASFKGRLSYGLPLLPTNRRGHWEDVTSGKQDAVFTAVAKQLVKHGHGDAMIRMGVEVNGAWFPWSVTTLTAPQYRAAFRHVAAVMAEVSPELTFWLDLNCSTALKGGPDRLSAITDLWPGDDVADGVSMDHYDSGVRAATDEAKWVRVTQPSWAPGLQDGVDFARKHKKGFAVPEWGLDDVNGPGDNSFFIERMFRFLSDNRDVVVYENYFNEPNSTIRSAIFETTENPKAAASYRKLWGRP